MSEPPVHVNAEGVHPHPHPTGHRLFDLTVAVSAIVISVISLFVAIEHSQTERRLVEANSWPFLQGNYSNADKAGNARISLFIANAGVGPAKLETLELFYRGQPLADPTALFARCCDIVPRGPGHPPINWVNGLPGGVLRAGETIEIFALAKTADNAPTWERLNRSLDQIRYRGCYCSVFDECWISDLQSFKPTPVKACPTPAVPYRPR